MKQGHLIVIDGANGSGKATQAKLLTDRLKAKKVRVLYVDFPQYYASLMGKILADYLKGHWGKLDEVSAYDISRIYALDRYSAKKEMLKTLTKGGTVVANRYVSSNMAFQGARFANLKDRKKYLEWLEHLEYEDHKIPREDIVIYLHVPTKFASELVLKKAKREYLKGKAKDLHESNNPYLLKVEKTYLKLLEEHPEWARIDCVRDGVLLPIDEIHEMIVTLLKERKLIPKSI